VLISVLVVVVCLTVVERRRLAVEQDRNSELLAKATAQREEAEDKFRKSEQKEQLAADAPRRAAELYRNAEQKERQASAERKAAEAEKKKADDILRQAQQKERAVEQERAQLAVAQKKVETDKAGFQAMIDLQETKRKENECKEQELVKGRQQNEAAERRAAAKEKASAEALKKVEVIQMSFKRALESSKGEVREAAALALVKMKMATDGGLTLPGVSYDLCEAVLRERDAKIREQLVFYYQEVSPELCAPVKTLFLDFETGTHAVHADALEKIRIQGVEGYGAAPAVQWYLERRLDKIKGARGLYASNGLTERAMEVLAVIAPGDPQTARVLCLALRTKLPDPYTYYHFSHYNSSMRSLSRAYEKNAQARAGAVMAMRIFLRNPEPKVAIRAAEILGALDPPPRDLLPYVRETQAIVLPAVQEAIAALAKRLE